jgi:hypothetical protein
MSVSKFCVLGRFDHHAEKNLPSKMMANWVFAVYLSGGDRRGLAARRVTQVHRPERNDGKSGALTLHNAHIGNPMDAKDAWPV